MYTLLLDTSTERGFVALAQKSELILVKRLKIGLFSSRELVPAVRHVFDTLSISCADLKAIGLGIGPGSYTGIRVGAAFALGLIAHFPTPLISFSSLTPFIVKKQSTPFVSLIPAKLRGAFGVKRQWRGEEIEELSPPRFYSFPELTELYQEATQIISPTPFSLSEGAPPLIESEQDLSFIANYIERKYAQQAFTQNKLNLLYLRECQYSTSSS